MGATIKLDLTSDVTHLIVGSIDSAKYRYVAKSRDDVKVLSPAWLEALREVWMSGDDDLDVAAQVPHAYSFRPQDMPDWLRQPYGTSPAPTRM
jgi:hypothetical protein